MALTWPSKESAEILDFSVDFSDRLATGDVIVTSAITVLAGAVVIDSQSSTATTSTAFLSGGTPGETCVLFCEVVTASDPSRTMDETIILPIAQQEADYEVSEEAVYQTIEDIDRYMVGSLSVSADAWLAAGIETKRRAAVSATRFLNRQTWLGTPTGGVESQVNAFPRTGIFYPPGNVPVPDDVIPTNFLYAVCELAGLLVSGSDIQDVPNTFSATRRLKAGSVEIEYFRAVGTPPRFPQVIQELIGCWLGGSGVIGSLSFGTCGKGIADRRYNVSEGF